MALNIDDELAALERISGLDEKHHLTLSKHVARLQAAIQLDIARTTLDAQHHLVDAQRQTTDIMGNASKQLSISMDAFAEASDRGTKELAKWSARTAMWTKWLTIATVALFAAGG